MPSRPPPPDTARPPLSERARAALDEALTDERRALATYRAAIARYGPTRPFVSIARSEQRHIDALLRLYARYRAPLPPAPPPIAPEDLPSTREEACAQAAVGEIENIRMYDERLFPAVAAYPDISAVMARLCDASRLNHLPAFRRCSASRRRLGPRPRPKFTA